MPPRSVEELLGHANANLPTWGLVTDNNDPEGRYRVKVKFPRLPGDDVSHWCEIATLGASKDGRGMHVLPDVNDTVLVVFVDGDINQGVVVGNVWHGSDKSVHANHSDKDKDGNTGTNDKIGFYSTPGLGLYMIRSKGEIGLTTPKGKRVVLSDEDKMILITDEHNNLIKIDTDKDVISVTSQNQIDIIAKKKMTIDSPKKEISDNEYLLIKAKKVTIQGDDNVHIESSGTGEFIASGDLTLKGANVLINS